VTSKNDRPVNNIDDDVEPKRGTLFDSAIQQCVDRFTKREYPLYRRPPYPVRGRFISHVEDRKNLYQRSCDNIGDAMQFAYNVTAWTFSSLNHGKAIVIDEFTRRVVAVLGDVSKSDKNPDNYRVIGPEAYTNAADHERMISLVLAWKANEEKGGTDFPEKLWKL
jgi:hypothetical protein